MSEMVERVARIIYDAGTLPRGNGQILWSYDEMKEKYLVMAHAAITEMREPTHEMCIVGPAWNSAARNIWQAMIDEALRDG